MILEYPTLDCSQIIRDIKRSWTSPLVIFDAADLLPVRAIASQPPYRSVRPRKPNLNLLTANPTQTLPRPAPPVCLSALWCPDLHSHLHSSSCDGLSWWSLAGPVYVWFRFTVGSISFTSSTIRFPRWYTRLGMVRVRNQWAYTYSNSKYRVIMYRSAIRNLLITGMSR